MNYEELWRLGETRHQEFLEAIPFPHVVIDDFLPDIDLALRSIPSDFAPFWKDTENDNTRGKSVIKARGLKERLFSPEGRDLLFEFHSASFLKFLYLLTGLDTLVGDPYLVEGGFHRVSDGGFLKPHADFSHHPQLGLERRLNLLLYLNPEWQERYGGHIKLYDKHKVEQASYLPILNRCLIFQTSDRSYHGHPEPLKLPEGIYRKSLALYYYSLPTGREKKSIVYP